MIVDRDRLARLLPGYELRDELGSGAFGMVLGGRHLRLKRDVAIKVLAASSRVSQVAFADEASLLAQMDHPHIVRVYDCVEQDGLCLIIMELLAGGTLRARQLTPEGACAVAIAIAEALSYAHAQGVLHRDIKPDNVLFDAGGLPKVTDFGVAKILEGTVALANSGTGTPAYMSPEQIEAAPLGPASDIYAVGVILFELLTGRLPFEPSEWRRRRYATVPRPAGVPRPVADLVVRALDPDPRKRGGSAHEFAVRLAAAAELGYGPDWRSRSGIVLRTGEETLDSAVRPGPATTRRPASPDGTGPRARTGPVPDPSTVGPRRRRNRRLSLVLAAALAVVIGVVVLVVSTVGSGHGSAGSLVDTPKPDDRTSTAGPARSVSPHPASPHAVAAGPVPFSPTGFIPDSVAFSPNGTMLAVGATAPGGGKGSTYLWSPATGSVRILPDLGSHGALAVAFSLDGSTLAVGDANGHVYLWNVATTAYLALPDKGSMGVDAVAFGPGNVLAAGDADGKTYLWNWKTGAPMGVLPDKSSMGVQSVAFSPRGGSVLAAGDADGSTYLWNWKTRTLIHKLTDPPGTDLVPVSADVESVAFDPMGTTLAAGDADGSTYLWNWQTFAHTGTLPDHGDESVQAVAFRPLSGTTLAVGAANGTTYLWNWAARTVETSLYTTSEKHGVSSLAFSKYGTAIAVGDHAGSAFVWQL